MRFPVIMTFPFLLSPVSSAMEGISVTATDMRQTYSGTQTLTAFSIQSDLVAGTTIIDSFTNTSDQWGRYFIPRRHGGWARLGCQFG